MGNLLQNFWGVCMHDLNDTKVSHVSQNTNNAHTMTFYVAVVSTP